VDHVNNEVQQTTSTAKNQTQASELVATKVWFGKLWLGIKQALFGSWMNGINRKPKS
jgi:hypothetical protein